jgi:hypothetical protein
MENICDEDMDPVITDNVMRTPEHYRLRLPFRFGETGSAPFQTQAKKMMVNTLFFYREVQAHPNLLTGSPYEIAARSLNVGVRSITNAESQVQDLSRGEQSSNKRLMKCSVRDKIDQFDIDFIRNSITGEFKQNRAPLLNNLFSKFLELKNKDLNSSWKSNFCSLNTFRRILHQLGYKFKKINLRAGIIQRPDIVEWRGYFIRELKRNRELPVPLEVYYIDETWAEANARTGKAWVKHKMSNIKEGEEFTYASTKPGVGGRLVILNAGKFQTHCIFG